MATCEVVKVRRLLESAFEWFRRSPTESGGICCALFDTLGLDRVCKTFRKDPVEKAGAALHLRDDIGGDRYTKGMRGRRERKRAGCSWR